MRGDMIMQEGRGTAPLARLKGGSGRESGCAEGERVIIYISGRADGARLFAHTAALF